MVMEQGSYTKLMELRMSGNNERESVINVLKMVIAAENHVPASSITPEYIKNGLADALRLADERQKHDEREEIKRQDIETADEHLQLAFEHLIKNF